MLEPKPVHVDTVDVLSRWLTRTAETDDIDAKAGVVQCLCLTPDARLTGKVPLADETDGSTGRAHARRPRSGGQ